MQGSLKTDYSGTTLAAVFLSGNALFTLNLGDSRVLLIRREEKESVTESEKKVMELGKSEEKEYDVGEVEEWAKGQVNDRDEIITT